MDPEQRAALNGAKLRAWIGRHWLDHVHDLSPRRFAAGAAYVSETAGRGWVLVDNSRVGPDPRDRDAADKQRGWLGGVVAWADSEGVNECHVICDRADGQDARRAAYFRLAPALWCVEGREAVRVRPIPFVEPEVPPVDVLAFAGLIEGCGADAVVEGGVLRAEVLGLEVGRVVVDDEGPVLRVGVGRHDQFANEMLNRDVATDVALRAVVAAVLQHRRGGAMAHPANQLQKERWLRHALVASPQLVGLTASLRPVAGTELLRLNRPAPAVAVNEDATLMVACSVGVDLDAVPFAADARATRARSADARLLLCVPEGADHAVTRRIAAALVHPAEVVTVPANWADDRA